MSVIIPIILTLIGIFITSKIIVDCENGDVDFMNENY